MRQFFIYFAVVTVFSAVVASEGVVISPGRIYEVNLLVHYPLSPEDSWAGVYGDVGVKRPESADYYSSPFGSVEISPADLDDVTASAELADPNRKLRVTDLNNWYVVLSENGELDFHSLRSTCDESLDVHFPSGDFCSGSCTPDSTFAREENIVVEGKSYCARTARIYENVPVYVLLAEDSSVVYLSKVGEYNILWERHNFGFLVSLLSPTTFYIYLVPAKRYCGDGICGSDEFSNCPEDCVSIRVQVTPTYAEANAGQTVKYAAILKNNGSMDVFPRLYVRLVSGEGNNCSVDVSPSSVTLTKGSEKNVTVSVTASAPGEYKMVLTAESEGIEFNSNAFVLRVLSPPQEETNGSAPSLAPPTGEVDVSETNEVVQLETGGFYIPWARCISNIGISGPDRVNSRLEENVVIRVYVQNGGTCEEDMEIEVEITPEEEVVVNPGRFTLQPGEGKGVLLHVSPRRPGLHYVKVSAKGLVAQTHRMELFVSAERAGGKGGCESNVSISLPDEIAVVEGEDIYTVVVKNAGSCREPVIIILSKRVGGKDIVLDRKEVRLSPGESYHYVVPRLAAGEYVLKVRAGSVEREARITVAAKPLLPAPEGAVPVYVVPLAVLLVLLLVLAGYVRYRYLR